VVERKPPAATYRRTGMSGVQRALLVAIFPAVLLLIYVCFWTMAMRGGYYRNELRTRIRTMQTENAELEAQKQKLQAPDKIALKAQVEQGMKIPGAREQLWLKASPAEPAPRQVSWRNTGAPAQP
jgi:cell division protein FtsL